MNVVRLKAETKSLMIDTLKTAGFDFVDDELIEASHKYFIVMTDKLKAPTGETLTNEEGESYPEYKLLDGCFASLVTDDEGLLSGIKEVAIEVNSPLITISGE